MVNKRQAKKEMQKRQEIELKITKRKELCDKCQWGGGVCFHIKAEDCSYFEPKINKDEMGAGIAFPIK